MVIAGQPEVPDERPGIIPRWYAPMCCFNFSGSRGDMNGKDVLFRAAHLQEQYAMSWSELMRDSSTPYWEYVRMVLVVNPYQAAKVLGRAEAGHGASFQRQTERLWPYTGHCRAEADTQGQRAISVPWESPRR